MVLAIVHAKACAKGGYGREVLSVLRQLSHMCNASNWAYEARGLLRNQEMLVQ